MHYDLSMDGSHGARSSGLDVMGLLYTRTLLSQWGRYGREPEHGYPQCSAFVSTVRATSHEMPELVSLVDKIVGQITKMREEHHHGLMLREHYLRHDTVRERLKRLRWSARRYYQSLDEAQWAVHVRLSA